MVALPRVALGSTGEAEGQPGAGGGEAERGSWGGRGVCWVGWAIGKAALEEEF